MYHFFVEPGQVHDNYVEILGGDVNHMKNVLRMKPMPTSPSLPPAN